MSTVKFVRGLAANYNSSTYANGIYFATDTNDIILDGVHYGAGDMADEIDGLQDAIELLNGDSTTSGSVAYAVNTAVTNLLNGAPTAFDTLKEIADWIGSGDVQNTTAANMLADISALKTKVGNAADGNTEATGLYAAIDSLSSTVSSNKSTIDNYTVNSKKISTNPVLSGADIAATGYTKASASAAISASDTINAALGKLEYKVDTNGSSLGTEIDAIESAVGLNADGTFTNSKTASGNPIASATTVVGAINALNDALVWIEAE